MGRLVWLIVCCLLLQRFLRSKPSGAGARRMLLLLAIGRVPQNSAFVLLAHNPFSANE